MYTILIISHFIEGSIEALKALQEMGYALVLVTNQSGIARGYFTEEEFNQLTEWMDWSLEDRGVHLDGIYYWTWYLLLSAPSKRCRQI